MYVCLCNHSSMQAPGDSPPLLTRQGWYPRQVSSPKWSGQIQSGAVLAITVEYSQLSDGSCTGSDYYALHAWQGKAGQVPSVPPPLKTCCRPDRNTGKSTAANKRKLSVQPSIVPTWPRPVKSKPAAPTRQWWVEGVLLGSCMVCK